MFLRRESTQTILNLADSALLGTGGEARIYSPPGGGTIVEISVPLARYLTAEAGA